MRDVRIANQRPTNETREHPTADVAAGSILDLRHFSAEIGQKKSGEWALNFLSDLDNFDSPQWLGHLRPSGTGLITPVRTAESSSFTVAQKGVQNPLEKDESGGLIHRRDRGQWAQWYPA